MSDISILIPKMDFMQAIRELKAASPVDESRKAMCGAWGPHLSHTKQFSALNRGHAIALVAIKHQLQSDERFLEKCDESTAYFKGLVDHFSSPTLHTNEDSNVRKAAKVLSTANVRKLERCQQIRRLAERKVKFSKAIGQCIRDCPELVDEWQGVAKPGAGYHLYRAVAILMTGQQHFTSEIITLENEIQPTSDRIPVPGHW